MKKTLANWFLLAGPEPSLPKPLRAGPGTPGGQWGPELLWSTTGPEPSTGLSRDSSHWSRSRAVPTSSPAPMLLNAVDSVHSFPFSHGAHMAPCSSTFKSCLPPPPRTLRVSPLLSCSAQCGFVKDLLCIKHRRWKR